MKKRDLGGEGALRRRRDAKAELEGARGDEGAGKDPGTINKCVARQKLSIKYYLQYQMATKDGRRGEMMALRSSRRVKSVDNRCEKDLEPENEAQQPHSNDHHNQIEDHKEQQISPKNEKESTSPPNHDQHLPSILEEKSRRVTRSTALLTKKICSDPDLHQQQVTPEDNPISKLEEDHTSKKMLKMPSAQSLSEVPSADYAATAKKPITSRVESLVSPYSQIRKSYRKIHKKEIISIPYRKCHDAFEGRIVSIINKIENGKNCLRDFESLIEKMQRITGKDMMNRFIIAGIKTISRLSREKNIYDLKLLERLNKQEERLRHKIDEELDSFDDFDHSLLSKNQQQLIDTRIYRRMTIRKIYKILKKKSGSRNMKQIREQAINDCQKYFNSEANVGNLIKFIKHKIDMTQE